MSISNSTQRSFIAALLAVFVFTLSGQAHGQLFRRALAQAEPKPVAPVVPPADAKPADPAAPDAAAPDAQGEKVLAIRIAALQGSVQVRARETDPWQIAKVNDELTIGSEIRTGLRSICRFTIDGNHTVTLDRLGVVKVLDAIKKDGKVKTDVGMKYGRTQYKVETGAAEHDSRVHAPAATLAVRGSFVTLEDNDAFGSRAVVDHSDNAIYKQRAPQGSVQVVEVQLQKGTIEQSPQSAGLTPPTPAMMALAETINDPGNRLAKTDLEQELIAQYPVFNGVPGGGGLPPTGSLTDEIKDTFQDIVSPGIISGSLQIFASHDSVETMVLFVTDPLGGKLSTLSNVPSGFDTFVRSGGPAHGVAFPSGSSLLAQYNSGVAAGSYGVGFSGLQPPPVAVNYFIDVFFQPDGSSGFSVASFEGTIDAAQPTASHGFGISSSTGGGSEGGGGEVLQGQ